MDNESIIGSVNDEALKRVLSNIEKAYGNLSDECGCYAGSCSRSRWLSVYNRRGATLSSFITATDKLANSGLSVI